MTPDSTENPLENSNPDRDFSPRSVSIVHMAVWDFGGRLAGLFVTFAVSIVLTRMLSPDEFGAFAITLSVISFSSIFVDLGFRSALVQSKDLNEQQLSTIFFVNLIIAGGLICFFATTAGIIESFYNVSGLKSYILGASLLFGINALSLVPSGLLQKGLRLKEIAAINMIAALVSGAIAIYLAFCGYKVWALVLQQIISALCILVGVTYRAKWHPTLSFSLTSIRELWRYGSRIFLSGLSDTMFSRLDVFIIGKLFPIQTLGFYNRAQTLDFWVRNLGASTTTSVAFPVIARMADDLQAVREFYRRCLGVIAFLSFLLIGVLFLTCFDIIIILFTERWAMVANYFRIMAVTGFVYPISALMVQLIAARGNAKAYLKLELIKKGILFPSYLSFFVGGVYFFLIALGTAYILALVANAYFVEKETEVSIKEQFWAIFKYGIVAFVVAVVVGGATAYIEHIYLHLTVSSLLFTALYVLFCYKLGLSGFREISERILTLYNDKRHSNISSAS